MSPVSLYSLSQLKKIRDNFVKELIDTSNGKKTSLAFVKNPLPIKAVVTNNEIFQIMIVGGTFFKKALVKKIKNQIVILEQKEALLPIFKTKEIFFSFFLEQFDLQINAVALNFAYHLKPVLRNGLIDGQLVTPTKEHQFIGLVNKVVGAELENFIHKKLQKKVRVAVANDSICLLLSSIIEPIISAGIVGAGTNFAFFLDKNTAVNLESGNFNKFPQTETGKTIDKLSANPGQQLFEKEVSGAYIYQHYNLLINRSENLQPINSTLELSKQAESDLRGQTQSVVTARKLIERSASLIACQIAGIYQYKKQTVDNRRWKIDGEDRKSKVENQSSILQHQDLFSNLYPRSSKLTFIIEGSVFWRGWHYKLMVNNYLEKLDIPLNVVKFTKINNSGIIGASRLITG